MYSKKICNFITILLWKKNPNNSIRFVSPTKTQTRHFGPGHDSVLGPPTRSPGRDLSILGVDPIFGQIPWRQQKCRPDRLKSTVTGGKKTHFRIPRWMKYGGNAKCFRMVKGLYLSHVRFHDIVDGSLTQPMAIHRLNNFFGIPNI